MYLAKIILDMHHPSIRQAVKDRQDMHRNLGNAFSPGFLYRIVKSKEQIELLTLSSLPPDQAKLEENGYHLGHIQDMGALPQLYREDSVLRFSLLTSPTKKAKEDTRQGHSRRVYLTSAEKRADWIKRQGDKYGFEILEVHEPGSEEKITVNRESGLFYLTAIELAGVLKITDSSQFWNAWAKGIGPEKAYGLGLMLLSR